MFGVSGLDWVGLSMEQGGTHGERGLVRERRHRVPRLRVQAQDDLDLARVRAAGREQRREDAVEAQGDLCAVGVSAGRVGRGARRGVGT